MVLAGCTALGGAKVATIQVEAPASLCWSGAIGDATRDGCGDATFEIDSSISIFVANAQKQSDDSRPLTLKLIIEGKVVDTATTTAAYGIATVSGQG